MANVLDGIRQNPKPLDASNWWKAQPPDAMADALDDEERDYLEFFTSPEVPTILHIGQGIADPNNLGPEDQKRAEKHFGTGPDARAKLANYENRRRIVAHYALTHPATVAYEMGLYRFSRDAIPPFFIFERVYELITGEEAFTGEQVSRINAAVDLVLIVVIAGVLKAVRPVPQTPVHSGSLTDPIWDLPPEGGGMRINGRWYTEHALERMAPDTIQVRAQLAARAAARLRRFGLTPESRAWKACFARAMQKIDPRGVPPSVVEAEIAKPGSTSVKVIKAKGGQVVVTVIPR
ncbi:MAG: hypothetical protein ACRENE_12780 [Polyangiaceae bacterium]